MLSCKRCFSSALFSVSQNLSYSHDDDDDDGSKSKHLHGIWHLIWVRCYVRFYIYKNTFNSHNNLGREADYLHFIDVENE